MRYNSSHVKPKPCYCNPETLEVSERKVTDNLIYFPSRLELQTYTLLRLFANSTHVKCHYPLVVKPATVQYDTITWKVDFRILKNESILNIEAKGLFDTDFIRNVKYLNYFNSKEYDRLILVGRESDYCRELQMKVYSLQEMCDYLEDWRF